MLHLPEEPIHPGRVLFDDFIADFGLSSARVAAETGIPITTLEALDDGSSSVTAEIALRLARYFSTTPEFWLNLQRTYDLALASKTAKGIDQIRPVAAA
ncbi:HigA family addiction module antitoxin [Rhizobium sp. AG855]|uniref:HigA family addiction module antitoxin n=1 Tax=Rhizobium sp. AG855 TaxID=2183898 RepID=UPI000E74606B|nr:HigA family addiction module antitoxin [Rhizobium sp. AG855]RKE84803.1 addiction module HigA family antidote [Rhizobium sp. AG855]